MSSSSIGFVMQPLLEPLCRFFFCCDWLDVHTWDGGCDELVNSKLRLVTGFHLL